MAEPAQPLAAAIAREQINLLLGLAKQAGIDGTRLRQELHLSHADWQRWLGVLHDAALPTQPTLSQMLRHLGYVTSRLDRAVRLARA
jgi:hypothetical protein